MRQVTSSARRRLYLSLDPRAQLKGLSALNKLLVLLILGATLMAVIETEPLIAGPYSGTFTWIERVFGLLFVVEYLARLWTAPERDASRGSFAQRLKFVLSPSGLADMVAIIASFAVTAGSGLMLLRLIRLGRILRLAKLGRMSRAFDHLSQAIASRRDELLLSLFAGLFLMVVAATLLHLVEGPVQPDKFGSIPRALWWAVATIGYGDVFPITPLGKVLAAATAIVSIGFIAMPTGILAAAFSDAMQRHQKTAETEAP